MLANLTTTNYSHEKDESNSLQSLQLGVLDIGWITPGKTATDVINETLMSASLADSLGYSRYWLTEHHESQFAWACPEIILTLIAQQTDRIRVGTAGILLYFYSSLKIAEIMRLLAILYPNRVDLGIAAGIAGDEETIQALASGFNIKQAIKNNLYEHKSNTLIDYIINYFPSKDRFADKAIPARNEIPKMWLLGTSGGTNMQLASARGTAFSYSLYHSCSQCDPSVVEKYYDRFQPSVMLDQPKCNLALSMICAETEAEAKQQQTLVEKVDRTTQVNVVGTLEQCKEQLLEIQHRYQVSEIIIISSWHIFEKRKLSYQMLAEAFNLLSDNELNN